jgi:gp16 family phage-associated protein
VSQVAREFGDSGISIAEWARHNGFNVNLVYQVLRGERKAIRGQTHDISVRLGIKKGTERGAARRQREP